MTYHTKTEDSAEVQYLKQILKHGYEESVLIHIHQSL